MAQVSRSSAQRAAVRAAKKEGVDPQIFLAMINQESGFNPNARSGAGAQGIAQFIPSTAKSYGVNLNDGRITDDLEGAARYLADNLKKTGGSYAKALSIYNSGRPDAFMDPHFAGGQTYNYVRSILGAAKKNGGLADAVTSGPQGSTTTVTPGVDNSGLRTQLIAAYLGTQHQPGALTSLAAGLAGARDVPGSSTTTPGTMPSSSGRTTSAKVATFEGKKVAGWIAPILAYARSQGWKGTITSGYRSYADQKRIYDSGVRPAAKPGTSNHEFTAFPGGAIDATDAARLAQILKGSPYASKLVWAGAKDPVHFSHPRNGTY